METKFNLSKLKTHTENLINCELLKHKEIRCKYKIDISETIPPPQIAWSLSNTKREGEAILGTLGNFSLIIGKAKSRKSFFINIAVSCALGKDIILNRFKSDLPIDKNEVVYFDTEQGKYHVQRAVKRICAQIKVIEPKNLHAYYLRSMTGFLSTIKLFIISLSFFLKYPSERAIKDNMSISTSYNSNILFIVFIGVLSNLFLKYFKLAYISPVSILTICSILDAKNVLFAFRS